MIALTDYFIKYIEADDYLDPQKYLLLEAMIQAHGDNPFTDVIRALAAVAILRVSEFNDDWVTCYNRTLRILNLHRLSRVPVPTKYVEHQEKFMAIHDALVDACYYELHDKRWSN